jgi:hypothetical protein
MSTLPASVSTPDAAYRSHRLAHAAVQRCWCARLYVDWQILAALCADHPARHGLTAVSYGEIVSAFSIAYMFANPIWAVPTTPVCGWG